MMDWMQALWVREPVRVVSWWWVVSLDSVPFGYRSRRATLQRTGVIVKSVPSFDKVGYLGRWTHGSIYWSIGPLSCPTTNRRCLAAARS